MATAACASCAACAVSRASAAPRASTYRRRHGAPRWAGRRTAAGSIATGRRGKGRGGGEGARRTALGSTIWAARDAFNMTQCAARAARDNPPRAMQVLPGASPDHRTTCAKPCRHSRPEGAMAWAQWHGRGRAETPAAARHAGSNRPRVAVRPAEPHPLDTRCTGWTRLEDGLRTRLATVERAAGREEHRQECPGGQAGGRVVVDTASGRPPPARPPQ